MALGPYRGSIEHDRAVDVVVVSRRRSGSREIRTTRLQGSLVLSGEQQLFS